MRPLALALAAAFLGGCATFSEDGGFGAVESALRERAAGEAKWVRSEREADSVRARVKELLAQPLSADAAAQIALLNNPGLQASYAEMGIAEAELVQASRWSGPRLSFARLRHGGEASDYERSVFLDLLGLITIPLATRAEAKRFEGTKARAAAQALRTALQARNAWFEAVAAAQAERYTEQVKESAEASAELARRMAGVGSWSRLNQAREQAFYAEATAKLSRARHARLSARERLTRAMGLWGEQAAAYRIPDRLPDLPQTPREGADLEAEALAKRLDVQAARRNSESLAESLGLTRATRFVNLLEVGYRREKEADEPKHSGFGVELRVPIFDFGSARTARAEHLYMQSVNRAAEVAIRARSEVREAYSAYRTAFDLARHYRDEVVPLRKRISEEVLLRYNGMLMSVFELLADSRDQIAAVSGYIDSLRGFWLAESDLQAALTSGSPGGTGVTLGPAMAPAPMGAPAH